MAGSHLTLNPKPPNPEPKNTEEMIDGRWLGHGHLTHSRIWLLEGWRMSLLMKGGTYLEQTIISGCLTIRLLLPGPPEYVK